MTVDGFPVVLGGVRLDGGEVDELGRVRRAPAARVAALEADAQEEAALAVEEELVLVERARAVEAQRFRPCARHEFGVLERRLSARQTHLAQSIALP